MDYNFDRLISDQFDWTIEDKALHDEVVRLRDRITALEVKISKLQPPLHESEADNGMDVKASGMAQSLGLDDAIRTVAKSGRNHDHGPNWYAEWDDLAISATFGAGTNSASVVALPMNHLLLYHADNFGRHIETFRYGPWAHRLIAHANDLRQAHVAQVKNDEAAKREAETAKFQEVDF